MQSDNCNDRATYAQIDEKYKEKALGKIMRLGKFKEEKEHCD